MERRDRLFLVTFVSSLSIIAFFMGASLFGYVIYSASMYCQGGVCQQFCYYDEDCPSGEVCCERIDFGVCTPQDECEHRFEMSPMAPLKLPSIESPSPARVNYLVLYSVLMLLIVLIGAAYFSYRLKK